MIMRDERCGDTIERLLDGLEALLQSRRVGRDDDHDAWTCGSDASRENLEDSKVRGGKGSPLWNGRVWRETWREV